MRCFAVRGLQLLLGGGSALLLGTAPVASQPSETVVHAALRPADWDLYLLDGILPDDTAKPRRLTSDPALDYNAALSPDGRRVVFTSERGGNPDLWVLDLEGPAVPRPLTRTPFLEDAAAFSPDGTRLAFVSTRTGNADIWTMPFRPDGPNAENEAVNLTRHPAGDFNPAFSPDGTRLAFASNRGLDDSVRGSDVWVMSADGSDLKRLTDARGWDGSPVFSADGAALVFYSERRGSAKIWRMGADGSDPQQVSDGGKAVSPCLAGGRAVWSEQNGRRWRCRATRAAS